MINIKNKIKLICLFLVLLFITTSCFLQPEIKYNLKTEHVDGKLKRTEMRVIHGKKEFTITQDFDADGKLISTDTTNSTTTK